MTILNEEYVVFVTGRDGVEIEAEGGRFLDPHDALDRRDAIREELSRGSWHVRVIDPDKVDPPCHGVVERCEDCDGTGLCPDCGRGPCHGCRGTGVSVS